MYTFIRSAVAGTLVIAAGTFATTSPVCPFMSMVSRSRPCPYHGRSVSTYWGVRQSLLLQALHSRLSWCHCECTFWCCSPILQVCRSTNCKYTRMTRPMLSLLSNSHTRQLHHPIYLHRTAHVWRFNAILHGRGGWRCRSFPPRLGHHPLRASLWT